MRLAVFTSKYPALISTFFERDMRALRAAGIDLQIFSLYPRDDRLWQYSLDSEADGDLRARTHHLGVLTALRDGGRELMRDPVQGTGVATRALAASLPYGPVAFAKSAYVIPKAWAWAKQFGGDFDHVLAYWGNYAGTCAWAFHEAIGGRIPFSIWLHAGADLYERPILLRRKMLHADNIITCCEFNRTYLADQFPDVYPRIVDRLTICHHGLDLATYPFTRDGRATDRIVAVGRLSKYKGFEHLLHAVASLARRGCDITLELVGGGELEGELRRLAASLEITPRVDFRGWLPHVGAKEAMTRGTMLVHPSNGLGDGLPNVLREAMALGLPVVASNVAGIPDALGDGCGVLVPPREPEALADAIEALLMNPGHASQIAENARKRVEREYDVWRNGRRLAALLLRTTRRPAHTTPFVPREQELFA